MRGMTNDAWREEWLRDTPKGRAGQPKEVAPAVVYLASVLHNTSSARHPVTDCDANLNVHVKVVVPSLDDPRDRTPAAAHQ